MITGADAITQMRKLEELIMDIRDLRLSDIQDCNAVGEYYADQLEQWRDEVTKAGGIKPLESYTELLAPGDKF